PYPFAIDESPGEEDRGRGAAHRCGPRTHRRILDAVADDPNAAFHAGTVLHQKLALASGQADDNVGAIDHGLLLSPLPDALRRSRPDLVFGAIERMHGIDDWQPEPVTQRLRDRPEPEGMQMEEICSPIAHPAHQSLDVLEPRGLEDHRTVAAATARDG